MNKIIFIIITLILGLLISCGSGKHADTSNLDFKISNNTLYVSRIDKTISWPKELAIYSIFTHDYLSSHVDSYGKTKIENREISSIGWIDSDYYQSNQPVTYYRQKKGIEKYPKIKIREDFYIKPESPDWSSSIFGKTRKNDLFLEKDLFSVYKISDWEYLSKLIPLKYWLEFYESFYIEDNKFNVYKLEYDVGKFPYEYVEINLDFVDEQSETPISQKIYVSYNIIKETTVEYEKILGLNSSKSMFYNDHKGRLDSKIKDYKKKIEPLNHIISTEIFTGNLIINTNVLDSYKIILQAKTENHSPISFEIKSDDSSRFNQSFLIKWPLLPKNVKITKGETIKPEIIKIK